MTKTNMYYEENPDSAHDIHELKVTLLGQHFSFLTDSGVFSKKMIDYGSRVLLNAIELDESKVKLLDVGCGYGTFGISLKKVYPFLEVDMVDVNNRALDLVKENLKANKLEANVYLSDVYENVSDQYDVIVTNPPIRAGKEVVTKILVQAKDHLNENGEIWVVIQKKQGAPSAKKNLEKVFGNVEIVKRDKGYYILKAINK